MAQGKNSTRLLRKQVPMRKVVAATLPCIAGSVYFFGWQALASVIVSCIFAFFTEYLFCRKRNEPVSEAVFVTAILFALIMPPNVPWHVLIIGVVFAIVFAKEVFGGFGRNIFNPAMAGRCFVYICFPVSMTGRWPVSAPLKGLGALTKWSTASIDTITSATPMALIKTGAPPPEITDLLFGGISGTIGVTAPLLILIGGIYLFYTKTANRLIILSLIISYGIFNQAFTWAGVPNFHGALTAVLGGGFLFGAFFMATDPISAPKTNSGRIIFAIIIALSATIIRNFSIFNGGMMFSILLGNMFAPIIDYAAASYAKRKKIAPPVEAKT